MLVKEAEFRKNLTRKFSSIVINLNTADAPEIMTIPGIDLEMARKIVAARDARGFFRSLDDLTAVGVVPIVMERVREMHAQAGVAYHRQ